MDVLPNALSNSLRTGWTSTFFGLATLLGFMTPSKELNPGATLFCWDLIQFSNSSTSPSFVLTVFFKSDISCDHCCNSASERLIFGGMDVLDSEGINLL